MHTPWYLVLPFEPLSDMSNKYTTYYQKLLLARYYYNFNGKITDRTPMETWVTDCANVIWSPTNLFFKMFAPIIKQSVNFDFLDFLSWAVGDFLYLEFLYMSVYIFGKFCFWNFEDYHQVKIQFSLFKGTVSGLRQFLANESPLKWWKVLFISP